MKFSVNIGGHKEEQSILDARLQSSEESEWVLHSILRPTDHIFCNMHEFEAWTCTSLKPNVCIVIDHSDCGYSFCDTRCTLSGWSKTVDMPLWWHSKSATSEQSQPYFAPGGMIQI